MWLWVLLGAVAGGLLTFFGIWLLAAWYFSRGRY